MVERIFSFKILKKLLRFTQKLNFQHLTVAVARKGPSEFKSTEIMIFLKLKANSKREAESSRPKNLAKQKIKTKRKEHEVQLKSC